MKSYARLKNDALNIVVVLNASALLNFRINLIKFLMVFQIIQSI